jgi:hypothetical protein
LAARYHEHTDLTLPEQLDLGGYPPALVFRAAEIAKRTGNLPHPDDILRLPQRWVHAISQILLLWQLTEPKKSETSE